MGHDFNAQGYKWTRKGGHKRPIYTYKSRTHKMSHWKVYKHHVVKACSQRVINDWNALPNYVVKEPSLTLTSTTPPLDRETYAILESSATGQAIFDGNKLLLLIFFLLNLHCSVTKHDSQTFVSTVCDG